VYDKVPLGKCFFDEANHCAINVMVGKIYYLGSRQSNHRVLFSIILRRSHLT